MSALEDAYRAAADAIADVGPDAEFEVYAKAAVNAFLAHLADNPPDEMVEAGGEAITAYRARPEGATDNDCWFDRRYAKFALSAALRSIASEEVEH